MILWSLDNIDMNTGIADNNGAQWWVTDSQGWFDSVDYRQTIVDRSTDNGSIMASSTMDKRRVHLNGVCRVTGTEDNIYRSREKLIAALTTITGSKVLKVNPAGVPQQSTYWSAGGTIIKLLPGGFEFNITLICEDPRKFSPVTTTVANIASGASANIVEFGTFQTPPSYTVNNITSNAATNPITITNVSGGSTIQTLQILSYAAALGEVKLVIDGMNRTVQGMNATGGNVVNRYGSLNTTSLLWGDLQPGANNNIAFTGTGYTLTPSYRDCWL